MRPFNELEARPERRGDDSDVEALPAYELEGDTPATATTTATAAERSSPQHHPPVEDLPAYELAGDPAAAAAGWSSPQSRPPDHSSRPIAIPQTRPVEGTSVAAPLVRAYPPSLLAYGITPDSWRPFLAAVSGLLATSAGGRAASHAADMGRELVERPLGLGRGILTNAKSYGDTIGRQGRGGNYAGAVASAIQAGITVPLSAVMLTVGTAVSLPAAAARALTKKPLTARDRAAACVATENRDRMHRRGLHAQLMDSAELARLAGVTVPILVDGARFSAEGSAAGRLRQLEEIIAPLEVEGNGGGLEVGARTLWLVVVRRERSGEVG